MNDTSLDIDYLFQHELSRRDFLLDTLALGGLAAAGLGWSANSLAADDGVLKIGYLPIADATALLVAHAYGYFEQQGLKVAQPTLVPSWARLIQGFMAGSFNLVHFLNPIPVWLRYNHDIPVKIMSWAHINGSAIIVGKHTNIKSFADLGGRQVAIPYWYSMHNILLQMALRHVGLKPVIKERHAQLAAHEVNLRVLPPPVMVPALMAQNIDAFIVAEPINAAGELKAGGKVLRFTGDMWKNHPCCVVCMHEQQIQAQPAWTQKVMNAVVQAQIYAQQHKEEVATVLSREGKNYIPVAANILKHAMLVYDAQRYAKPDAIVHQQQWQNGRIDFSPWPYPSATRLLVDAMNQTLVSSNAQFLTQLDADFVVKDLVDYHFVKTAMQHYPGWETAPGVDLEHPFERQEVIAI